MCPVNIYEAFSPCFAALEVEPLSQGPQPRERAPSNKVKSQDCTHFAVLFLSVNMLICTELSYLSLNQVSSLKKKPIVDHCGE